ncbi:MAG: transcriptional regulator, AraC family [Myxococcaceae bacterium]|nr:transcriptional regulator, AraC family [Myxococcaceae bacterium]
MRDVDRALGADEARLVHAHPPERHVQLAERFARRGEPERRAHERIPARRALSLSVAYDLAAHVGRPSPSEGSTVCPAFVHGVMRELENVDQPLAARALAAALEQPVASAQLEPVPMAEFERCLQEESARLGDAAPGLTVGLRAPLALLPALAKLRLGMTLREVLTALRYGGGAASGIALELVERGDLATLSCALPLGHPVFARFYAEYLFATLVRVIETLHPQLQVELQRVRFSHAAPKLDHRHASALRGPVLFKQKGNAIRFARSLLDRPQHASQPAVLVMGAARPTSERVRAHLATHPALDKIDSDSLAGELGLTWRALRRRLAADGTSLTALVDEARCRVACAALQRGVPIKAVAQQAGYSDHSGLFRAFKRCTGMTPAAYRRRVWRARLEREDHSVAL